MRYDPARLELPGRLETPRLVLRSPDPADVDCFWQMDSDPNVMRYVAPVATDRLVHRDALLKDLAAGQRFRFLRVIQDKNEGQALGWVFLRPTADGQWLELGYRLLPEAWGRGVATEASGVIIEHAFETWQAADAMALIMPGNRASKRVAEKVGMRLREITSDFYDETLELWVVESSQ